MLKFIFNVNGKNIINICKLKLIPKFSGQTVTNLNIVLIYNFIKLKGYKLQYTQITNTDNQIITIPIAAWGRTKRVGLN